MLEQVHPDAIAKTNGQTRRQDGRTEAEVPEDHAPHQQRKKPGSPCPVIREESHEVIGPRGDPVAIDEDLQLLVHAPFLIRFPSGYPNIFHSDEEETGDPSSL